MKLNDQDCCVIKCENEFLLDMAHALLEINLQSLPGKMHSKMLTVYTSEALSLQIRGIMELTKVLLNQGLACAMLEEF